MVSSVIPTPYNHASFKRRKQTWYTIADGNWSNPNIWASNGRRRYSYPSFTLGPPTSNPTTVYPTSNDDVFINHNVVLDISSATVSSVQVNNLYISGNLTMNSALPRGITVVGDLQCTGTLDLSGSANSAIVLYGVNNFVNNFISGTSSTVYYTRTGDQSIMDLSYRNLSLYNTGRKSLTNNLTLTGNLNTTYATPTGGGGSAATSCILECSTYNLTVNGTTTLTGGVISKTGSGSLLFIGAFTTNASNLFQGVDLSGNPTVEFRGGLTAQGGGNIVWNTGTGTWSATTATQTWTFTSNTYVFTAPVSIVGAITLNEAGTGIMQLNQPINCTAAGGSLVGKGIIYFNATASLPSMTTGTFDRTTNANTVGYTMPSSITLPYTTYYSLLISNSGTKTASGNTSLLGNLSLNTTVSSNAPTFELSTFNLTVAGTTALGTANFVNATLSKTGAGSVLFTGLVTLANSNTTAIDFTTGNPTVELRGGMTMVNNVVTSVKTGTGQWVFTTNSQSISGGGTATLRFDAPVLISGAITVSVVSFAGVNTANSNFPSNSLYLSQSTTDSFSAQNVQFYNTLNGDNVGSTLQNRSWVDLFYINPMAVGVFDRSSFANTTGYVGDGDFTLPFTTYSSLYIGGGGTKTLAGNTTLTGSLLMNAKTTLDRKLELSTYDLTVATSIIQVGTSNGSPHTSTISKTGAGTVTTGFLTISNNNAAGLDFSVGNPTVEVKNGITFSNVSANTFKTGTGIWTFSTANQSIIGGAGTVHTFDCPIIISGAITLTLTGTINSIVFNNTVNGNNASSTLDNRLTTSGSLQYQATQRPMLTGVLQTNAAANIFKYNKAGNQDITGGTYRTLEIGGTATPNNKTLQGNVVAATAFSTTGNAALVLNGFTRT